jgi:hypothetical protein
LRFPAPATAASEEFNRRLDAYDGAVGRRRQVDQDQREAHEAAVRASEELVALERQRQQGDEAPAATIRSAEQKLAKAKARVEEPWPERRRAADDLVRGAERAVLGHVHDHGEELITEIEQEGQDAARAVDDAATLLVEAHRRRGAVEQRLVHVVHELFPGDESRVTRSGADQVATLAARLASQGEDAPRIDRAFLPRVEWPAEVEA